MPKKSIWIGAPIEALLAERRSPAADAEFNASRVINAAVERYREIVRAHMPTLTRGEWCAVFDANNGYFMGDAWNATMLWANVLDSDELDQKWGIDSAALAEKMRAWPFATSVAVADAHERFWARCNEDTDSVLREIVGAKNVA